MAKHSEDPSEDEMKKLSDVLLQPALAAMLLAPVAMAQDPGLQPPVAKKVLHVTKVNGTTLKDNYFWLRDKKDPDVMKYLKAENAYTEEVMKADEGFSKGSLYKEMLSHMKQTDLSVPAREAGFLLFADGGGKAVSVRMPRLGSVDAPEEILLDLNKLAEGHSFLGLGELMSATTGICSRIPWI